MSKDKMPVIDSGWVIEDPVARALRKARAKERGPSRREFLARGSAALGAVTALTLPACRSSNEGGEKSGAPTPLTKAMTLTSGYIPIVDSTPIPIAYAKGFFKEMGLKAEKPVLIRGWAPLLEAFIADQILLTHILLFELMFMRYEQKLPVRSIAFNHLNGIGILGGKGVKSIKELGGKTVGCPIWWAVHTLLFQECLRAVGLKPVVHRQGEALAPNEVAFRVLAPPDMPNALKTGAIGGAVVSEGFAAASEVLADSTLLRMTGDIWRNHPCCQSVLMQRTIDKDRSWAQAVTTAIARACAWCEQNREEMVDILSKEGGGYFPLPKKIIERAVNYTSLKEYGVQTGTGAIRHPEWHIKRLALNPYPYPSAFELSVKLMKQNVVDPSVALTEALKAVDPKQAAQDIVNYDFITEAVQKIGGLNQFDGVDPQHPFERHEMFEV